MKYLSCADTAAMVRKALKESFPGIKFSVRSSVYSGGASIYVKWVDGPNSAQVDAVAQVFAGSYFDGSIDYQGSRYAMIDGLQVRFGADFIFCERSYSDDMVGRAIASVSRKYGIDPEDVPSAEDWQKGRLFARYIDGSQQDLAALISIRLHKMSDRLNVNPSKIAGKVIYLGNDGYSERGALVGEDE